jgi:hypothetical protein
MSAQGATLRRGTAHLPIWPVAALVTAAVATLIGMSLIDGVRPQGIVTSVTRTERLANSSAAIREQGAVLPIVWGTSHVTPSQAGFAGFENPGAYITEAPAFAGFENPAAYAPAWDSVGGPNEALHRQYTPPQEGVALRAGSNPIIVNGEACMQCR